MVDHRPLRRDDLGTPGQVEARLVIRLLGEVAVSLDGSPLLDLTTLRLQRLLGRLALAPNAGLRRDRLAYQLWPDSTEPQARTNLRKLHDLRRSLPDPDEFLDAGTHTVRWNTRASCVTSVSPRISPRMR
jgi:DNA-binding SARP family transcriptional activator